MPNSQFSSATASETEQTSGSVANYAPVEAVVRAVAILTCLNQLEKASIGAIFASTAIPKPTIVRMLETFISTGHVMRTSDGHYVVTARALSLSCGYSARANLLAVATPLLEAFRRNNGWPSDLAILDAESMVILQTNREPSMLSLNRSVGSRVPAALTSLGRAYLAFAHSEERESALDAIKRSDPTFDVAAFSEALEMVRANKYAMNFLETSQALAGVGVPVLVDEHSVAAINLIFVANVVDRQKIEIDWVPRLRELAAEIGARLPRGLRI